MDDKGRFGIATESSIFGTEEASAKIMEQMIDPKFNIVKTSSDITANEVFGLASLTCFADAFKSKMINKWMNEFLLLRISRNRMGRKEFQIMIAGLRQHEESKMKGKSFGSLFGGLR